MPASLTSIFFSFFLLFFFFFIPLSPLAQLLPGNAANGLLDIADPRVRSIPFATARPTLRELTRIYAKLVTLEPLSEEPDFVKAHRKQVRLFCVHDGCLVSGS